MVWQMATGEVMPYPGLRHMQVGALLSCLQMFTRSSSWAKAWALGGLPFGTVCTPNVRAAQQNSLAPLLITIVDVPCMVR